MCFTFELQPSSNSPLQSVQAVILHLALFRLSCSSHAPASQIFYYQWIIEEALFQVGQMLQVAQPGQQASKRHFVVTQRSIDLGPLLSHRSDTLSIYNMECYWCVVLTIPEHSHDKNYSCKLFSLMRCFRFSSQVQSISCNVSSLITFINFSKLYNINNQ